MAPADLADSSPPADIESSTEPSTVQVATEIRGTLGALYRRIKQTRMTGDLTLPESSALSRLQREGPMTAAQLARHERISPQSMGATVASLQARGLIRRGSDPADGRRIIVSLTRAGDESVAARRSARDEQLTRALAGLTADERARLIDALPVLDRLAEEL